MPTIINSVPALVVPEPTLAASRLESMNACPGYVKDIFERNMDAADDGKAIHKAIEDGIIPEDFSSEQREMVEWSLGLLSLESEDPSEQRGYADVHHEYELAIPFIVKPGYIDVLILFGDNTATIIDWKTGRNKQAHPSENLQFRAYACGVWMQNPALKSIEIIAAYPRMKIVERATFLYPDFTATMEKLAEISWLAKNYSGKLTPNEDCGFCGRASTCPALTTSCLKVAAVRGIDLPPNLDPNLVPLDRLDVLAYMRDIGSQMEKWYKAVKARTNHIAVKMNLDLPGYSVVSRAGTRTFRDGNAVMGLVNATFKELGITATISPTDLLASAAPKVTDVEKLVAAAVPKGQGKKAVELFKSIAASANAIAEDEDSTFLKRDPNVQITLMP